MSRTHPRKRPVLALFLLLLCLGLGGAMWYCRDRSALPQVMELRDRLTSPTSSPLPADQRPRQFRELREAIDALSPTQRREFWADRRRQFQDWLKDFFRSSRQEQTALLHVEIDRMQAFRDRETKNEIGAAGGLWANGLNEENREQRRKQWLDLASPEERALVDVYFEMLAQQGGQGGDRSPWGDAPT